ncbi:hypothetical protein CYMTET_43248 [Cymbomonas tetramitiformis]|uniref:Uncharacterized protein n=1 Tax=Cymbomonas tetramitiformis TaxID=36881 RepID=A0AAE0C3M8_9CHLO|nr:hypothetical protein CYMTET_43248 [Cymbomonas tetramitiformis]
MNPSINTALEGPIFQGRSAWFDIMESEYKQKLHVRGAHLLSGVVTVAGGTAKGKEVTTSTAAATASASAVSAASAAAAAPAASNAPGASAASAASAVSKGEPNKRRRTTMADLAAIYSQDVVEVAEEKDHLEAVIENEIQLFASACKAAKADPVYRDTTGKFLLLKFYDAHRDTLKIHTAVWRGDVASKKCSSANVECTFSGAGVLLADYHSHNMSPELLQAYMLVKGNWQYPCLRPTVEQIKARYDKKYGKCKPDEVGSPESESSDEDA